MSNLQNNRVLKKLGYTVLEACNGFDAVELYKKLPDKIKLVVLDVVMPDMGGGEVYDRLKEINPEVKVLLASGYSIDDQARKIIERGCNGFIQKPFSMKTMSDKIIDILSKKSAIELGAQLRDSPPRGLVICY